jgi:tetratricopeptide (TPR) repeat protein
MQATLRICLALVVIGLFLVLKHRQHLKDKLYTTAMEFLREQKFKEAMEEFERLVSYTPNSELGLAAAKKAGEISLYEVKDYNRAIFFFRTITRNSQNKEDLKYAQRKLGEIYYEKLSDYNQAVVEFSRLMQLDLDKEEMQQVHQRITKAYYYAANFDQAVLEVDEFEKKWPDSPYFFDVQVVKANALLGQKKFDEAIKVFDQIIERFPDKNNIAEIYINKAQALEEKKELDKAIQILESIKARYEHPDILDMKIKSLQRRKEKKATE